MFSFRSLCLNVVIVFTCLASSCNGNDDAQFGRTSPQSAESRNPAIPTDVSPNETQILVVTPATTLEPVLEVPTMVFQLSSPAFLHKSEIPLIYSCKGDNISPELNWSDPPNGTLSYALIMDDPDAPAGTWVHWIMYNIDGKMRDLPKSVPVKKEIADMGMSGINSWSKYGYGGPCPPVGTHRYFFRLYALDTKLDLQPGATKPEVIKAMQGHILAVAELMGTFTH